MIKPSDNLYTSALAIRTIWLKRKPTVYFPKIPTDLDTAQMPDFLNGWLFKTGLYKPSDYRAAYDAAEKPFYYVDQAGEAKQILDEIFCQ